ncbi:MAG: tRNA pseudouridine(55) synthase TruB [Blastopirellula sp.]|nr:MAG: tRNA pseudouridine(55) synthase TruB [Blastopirellula sp.]
MDGILVLNKPEGMTSRGAVNRVQRRIRPVKVGHAGTLDPLATGVLVCCLGAATRLIEYIQMMPKTYIGTFELGKTSDTEDITGEITLFEDAPEITRDQLEQLLPEFLGTIQQRPPSYSAIHVDGQRAYHLARQGQHVELPSRPVQIHSLKLLEFAYPHFTLEINCGSGTYVRSLGRDIALRLNSGAVMSELERTAIGQFNLADAQHPDSLDDFNWQQDLKSLETAITLLPQILLTDHEINELKFGRFIDREIEAEISLKATTDEVAALTESGQLVAILMKRSPGVWKTAKNFSHLLSE